METLHNLIGPTQSILILGIIGILLLLLIVKAIKQGGNKNQLPEQEQRAISPTVESKPSQHIPVHDRVMAPVIQNVADSAIAEQSRSVANKPAVKVVYLSDVPEDSVLRRHYLTEQATKKAALGNPIPTDSILRRHYEALHQVVVVNSPKKASSIEQAIGREMRAVVAAPLVKETTSVQPLETINAVKKAELPEDSVLKRYFIGQLQAEIQAGFSTKPTDSVLRRHYDYLMSSEVKKRLAD